MPVMSSGGNTIFVINVYSFVAFGFPCQIRMKKHNIINNNTQKKNNAKKYNNIGQDDT